MAFEALIQTPWQGPWRRFVNPVAILQTASPRDVIACLAEADDRVRREQLFAAGFVSYDAAAGFDLPVAAADPAGPPLVCVGLFQPDSVSTLAKLPEGSGHQIGEWTPSIDRAHYYAAVQRIKDHIAAGDTYQINFTFRLRSPFEGDPRSLMRQIAAAQAGQWGAYVETDTHALCSASPELFFAVTGDRIACRPMKGTAPRGLYRADDEGQGRRLRDSEKNRAENVMIVDMVRNDLGRVARYGSVKVTSLYDVERYPAQWQMTSGVEAQLDGAATPTLSRLFEAMFPSGSVTGAPKHRSMSIIRDLEGGPRGVYTGAIGYITPAREAHFNVAIRTVAIDKRSGQAEFGAGSGIVWDSSDRDEYAECLLKASILEARSSPLVAAGAADFELLETMKWTPGGGFTLLDRHLDRLTDSAAYFGFTCSLDRVHEALTAAVAGRTSAARVRLRVARNGTAACDVSELAPVPPVMRAALAAVPVDSRNVFLYHKTTRRRIYDEAQASRPGADTVILWNEAGEITEAVAHNVVVEIGGRRITPPVECGLLAGTLRAELLASGAIDVDRITVDQLASATGLWVINSVSGEIPVLVEPAAHAGVASKSLT